MDDIFEELREQDDLREIEEIQDIDVEEAIEVPTHDADGTNDVENEAKKVQVKIRKVSRPRQKLDAQRLTGPRGLEAIVPTFENIKFKGKGHELDDLTNVLARLQHWAHRLYPNLNFEDCIDKIEELGSKKPVIRAMESLRTGTNDDVVVQHEDKEPMSEPAVEDPFDKLLPPKPSPQKTTLTDEQRARMLKNRLIAEERRIARMKAANESQPIAQ